MMNEELSQDLEAFVKCTDKKLEDPALDSTALKEAYQWVQKSQMLVVCHKNARGEELLSAVAATLVAFSQDSVFDSRITKVATMGQQVASAAETLLSLDQ